MQILPSSLPHRLLKEAAQKQLSLNDLGARLEEIQYYFGGSPWFHPGFILVSSLTSTHVPTGLLRTWTTSS